MSELPVREVAPAHKFDEKRLESFLKDRIEPFDRLRIQQFQGGASNPTFLLTAEGPGAGRRYVMRKKPPGPLLPSAHQVDREYRVMKALNFRARAFPCRYMRACSARIAGDHRHRVLRDGLSGRAASSAMRGCPDSAPAERAAIYDQAQSHARQAAQGRLRSAWLGRFRPSGKLFRAPDRALDQAVSRRRD